MSGVEKISVSLPEELVARMRAAVDAGDYASTGEVIRDAMRDWTLKQQAKAAEIERLRKAWQEGIDSGSAGAFDIEEILAAAREEFDRRKAASDTDAA